MKVINQLLHLYILYTWEGTISIGYRILYRSTNDWLYAKYMAVCQNLVPLVNIKIAGKWMSIPLKMVLIGIDPYPYVYLMGQWSFQEPKLEVPTI